MKKKSILKVISAVMAAAMLITSVPAVSLAAEAKAETKAADDVLKLWYDEPVSGGTTILSAGSFGTTTEDNMWQQLTIPIGNSYMGANVYGEIANERLTFNQKTLWNGGPSESRSDYDGGNKETANGKAMSEVYEDVVNAFLNGDANASSMCNYLTGESAGYGAYQSWGDIYLTFSGLTNSTATTGYERNLDMMTGIANVDFTVNSTDYHREYFISYPDNVLAMKLTAEGSSKMNLNVSFPIDNAENVTNSNLGKNVTYTVDAAAGTIVTAGSMQDNQMKLNSVLQVVTEGQVSANGDSLDIANADEVIIFVSADTDYKNDYPTYRTGETDEELAESVAAVVSAAAEKGYDAVKEDHLADYQELFARVDLDLGQEASAKTTDALLSAYKADTASDSERALLEVLLYQYGRYLTIASSRDGDLPSNLQGVWQNRVGDAGRVPWGSDYHMNVNLQMNYWPTYSANLAECATPLIDYVESLREPGRVTAATYYGITSEDGEANGFTAHTQNTPFGWTCPGWDFSWGWSPAAVPWILQNCWEYYEYTGDVEYMKENIYPMLKEEAILYDQILVDSGVEITLEDGTKSTRLVSAPAYSPEHGPRTLGNVYEQVLIWQLYEDVIIAAETLGVDEDLVAVWKENQSRLSPIEVGDSGQIKEWYHETTLGSVGERGHRHMSHLLAMFPGDLISVDNDTYMDAAIVSLTDRGMQSTGWGMGQRLNSWARTGQGNKAYQLIETLFSSGIYPNLWDSHAPFQIDGNFGYTSGVNEMLMQSNMGYINVLPALPDAWADGSVKGIVARGNFELGITWANGKATSVEILSNNGGECAVQYTGISGAIVKDSKGNDVEMAILGRDRISFASVEGETYTITGFAELSDAPANVKAEYGTEDIIVSWDAVSGADFYVVYRKDGDEYVKAAEDVKATSWTDAEELEDVTLVRYKVAAVVDGVEGEHSEAVSVTDTTAGTWIDNTDSSIIYTGSGWGDWEEAKNYNGTIKYNNSPTSGDSIEMSFTGVGIEVITSNNTGYGTYQVLIDGTPAGTIDCSGTQSLSQQLVYSNKELSSGTHTIKLVANGDGKVEFDAFVVYTSTATREVTVTFATARELTSGNMPGDVTVNAGSTITLPECDGKVTGYMITGWSDGSTTYAVGDEYSVPGKNVILEAVWSKADYIAISKDGWTATAGSEENSGTDGPASWAIDGSTSTIWHSAYSSGKTQPTISENGTNNEFTIDFGQTVTVGKFEYIPRTQINGRILGYQIWYSTTESGDDFVQLTYGSWENNTEAKAATFANTEMRRIQIRATATNGDSAQNKFISAAEFNVYTAASGDIVPAESVTTDTEIVLASGESQRLEVNVAPENATYKEVTYSTSDYKLVTVSADGMVTANKLGRTGTATITVTTEDGGHTATCKVTVLPLEAENVKISEEIVMMEAGSTISLSASTTPYYATERKLTWTIDNEDVISRENGVVTALKAGKATITAANASGVSAVCSVYVYEGELSAEREALYDEICKAADMELEGYDEALVKEFQAALAAAEAALANSGAGTTEHKDALTKLQAAIANLSKGNQAGDNQALAAALDTASKIDLTGYTAESVQAFQNALANAKAVLANANAAQAEIDAALNALTAAQKGLTKAQGSVAKVPAAGTVTTVGDLQYKVTKSDAAAGTVAVSKLVNTKKAKIVIPDTVVIDGYTFKVTAINKNVFQKNKKIKSVVIGANVTKIGAKAFFKVSKLKNILFKGTKAPKIGKQAFKGIKATCKVRVPKKMNAKQLKKLKKGMKSAGKKIKFKK